MKKWLFVVLFALASIAPAQSSTLTWTLQNVVFDDGGTAIGSFGYDADTNTFSAINITTSVNDDLSLGTTYVLPTGVGYARLFDTIMGVPPTGQPRLSAFLTSAMTNLGGTIAALVAEVVCPDDICSIAFSRIAQDGSITASPVPIPAALPLFAAGLGAMGFFGWRRRRKALAI